MKEEIWKDIPGYEGEYKVSNMGNVYSIIKHRLSSLMLNKTLGYLFVNLHGKNYRVHRLVALTFIPNPENKPYIDHINTIKTDNRVENLRWCTPMENTHNPISFTKMVEAIKKANIGKFGIKNGKHKKVYQYNKDGTFIKEQDSISDAARFYNTDRSNIVCNCKGKTRHSVGFLWSYEKKDSIPPMRFIDGVSIIQMKENGEYIKEWKSIKEAASFYNVTPSAIRCALTGYRSRACGYKWKYKSKCSG